MWTCESIRPGIAIIPLASIATSQSATSPADPIEAILPSTITTVSPATTGDAILPLRIFAILKTATFIASGPFRVFFCHHLLMGEAADPRIEPPAIGNAEDDGDFVR